MRIHAAFTRLLTSVGVQSAEQKNKAHLMEISKELAEAGELYAHLHTTLERIDNKTHGYNLMFDHERAMCRRGVLRDIEQSRTLMRHLTDQQQQFA